MSYRRELLPVADPKPSDAAGFTADLAVLCAWLETQDPATLQRAGKTP